MKILKKILIGVLSLFLVVIVVLVGAGYYAYKNPEKVWALIEEKFLPEDLKITWSDLEIRSGHEDLRHWKPFVDLKDLCIRKKDPFVDVCLDTLEVTSSLAFQKWNQPQLEVFKVFAVSTYSNAFRPSSKPQEKKSEEMNFYEMMDVWRKRLRSWSGYVVVRETNVNVQSFRLLSTTGAEPLHFRVILYSPMVIEKINYDFAMKRGDALSFESRGLIELQHFLDEKEQFASLEAGLQMPKAGVDVTKLSLKWDSEKRVDGQIHAFVQVPQKADAKIQLEMELSPTDLKVKSTSQIEGLKKPFAQLKPIVAEFALPQEKGRLWAKERSNYSIVAYLPLFFVKPSMIPEIEKSCQCDLPEELKIEGKGTADLNHYFSKKDGFIAETTVVIQSLTNELFSTDTVLKAEVNRRDNEFKIAPFIDSKIQIPSFKKIVGLLLTQKIVVPAPLNVLDGKIQFAMKGPLEKSEENWKIPYVVTVDLGSERQRVDLETTGDVNIALNQKVIDSNISILIRQLNLQLPPIDPVFGLPKVTQDKRFELKPPVAKKKSTNAFKIRFAVQIRTQNPDSIRLLSGLADPYIPIGIQMNYQSGSPLKGTIDLAKFNVEYLRRRSTIENLELALNEPQGNFPLKGRFRVDQNPYKIYIDVLGNLKSPRIILSSEPYLDRSDIISVLLYGRKSDKLVSADSQIVGSFDAAMADRAIGLFGMWAFSSTPIQSFSYNQLSKEYTASLKVSDDTTLAVGTNWEQSASLELQKRLSDRWIVSASLEPTETDEQTRELRLQWEDRF